MPNITIVILANSVKKKPGRCIAGREVVISGKGVSLGEWIRPVSPDGEAKEGELLAVHHRTIKNVAVDVLDIFEVPLARQRTDLGQPENWDVITDVPWKRLGTLKRKSLPKLVESPPHLWDIDIPGDRRVHVDAPIGKRGRSSLALIQPSNFRVLVQRERKPWNNYESTKVRGAFSYAGRNYSLDLTDDSFAPQVRAQATSLQIEYRPPFGDKCLLCVSLSAPFNGYHYKLIAAVIPLEEHAP
jgi:hypothetical protein